jgi:hypothetical protein
MFGTIRVRPRSGVFAPLFIHLFGAGQNSAGSRSRFQNKSAACSWLVVLGAGLLSFDIIARLAAANHSCSSRIRHLLPRIAVR